MKLGVIGWPIAHSKSPAMQNGRAAPRSASTASYTALAVAPDEAGAASSSTRRATASAALNVTIPHKEAALALCAPDELARAVGAVNTLVFEGDKPRRLQHRRARLPRDGARSRRAARRHASCMLGAGGGGARGGGARSIGHAQAGDRRRARRATFASTACAMTVTPWETSVAGQAVAARRRAGRRDAARARPNAPRDRSVAAAGARGGARSGGRARHGADAAARARGLKAAAGTAMLLHQGARALELWTGKTAPVEVMRKALDAAL